MNRKRRKRQESSSTNDDYPRVTLPPSLFESLSSEVGVFFILYNDPVFFPLAEGVRPDIEIGSPVIGATVVDVTPIVELEDNVTIVFQLENAVSSII